MFSWVVELTRMQAYSPSNETLNNSLKMYIDISESIKKLIVNNPLLFHPFKDEQAIDIGLTSFYLLQQDGKEVVPLV